MKAGFEIITNIESLRVILRNKQLPKAIAILLILLICVSIAFPIIAVIQAPQDVKASFVITLALFWGTALYFIRLLIWNRQGYWEMNLEESLVTVHSQLGFIRMSKESIGVTELSPPVLSVSNKRLTIQVDNKKLESTVEIENEHLFVSELKVALTKERNWRLEVGNFDSVSK